MNSLMAPNVESNIGSMTGFSKTQAVDLCIVHTSNHSAEIRVSLLIKDTLKLLIIFKVLLKVKLIQMRDIF